MAKKIRLIHITPELPPTIGGVADYTAILSRRLVEESDGAVEPVLVRAGCTKGDKPKTKFKTRDLAGFCSAEKLAETIAELVNEYDKRSVLLVEYSGYGYANRGAPLWLLQGLKNACRKDKIPLITMFHELYATGKPWSSAFWLSPMQRYITAQLARLSSAVITNRKTSAEWLNRYLNARKPLHMQPVFSNIGEPETVPSFDEREPYAVVFGGAGMKQQLYSEINASFEKWLRKAGIKRIVDVGKPCISFKSLNQIAVEKIGIQPPSIVSHHLQSAKMGFLQMPMDCLTKSGVFSAYIAHGLPVGVFAEPDNADPLKEGHHFIRIDNKTASEIGDENISKIGQNAFGWYRKNSTSYETGNFFAELIDSKL